MVIKSLPGIEEASVELSAAPSVVSFNPAIRALLVQSYVFCKYDLMIIIFIFIFLRARIRFCYRDSFTSFAMFSSV